MLKWTSNTFKDILELKDGTVTYADSGRGNLKMENHPYPSGENLGIVINV